MPALHAKSFTVQHKSIVGNNYWKGRGREEEDYEGFREEEELILSVGCFLFF